MRRFLLPLGIFVVLVGFLAVGLRLNPREVPSPFIDKPAPQFSLPTLNDSASTLSPADMLGKVWLLNVWASWCVSCRAEHPLLVEFAKRDLVPIVGLNYKELRGDGGIDPARIPAGEELGLARERAQRWLGEHGGNPYYASVMDLDGRVGIDFGVYGVPETFVVDKSGVIRHKHIGPLNPEALQNKIIPLVQELNAKS